MNTYHNTYTKLIEIYNIFTKVHSDIMFLSYDDFEHYLMCNKVNLRKRTSFVKHAHKLYSHLIRLNRCYNITRCDINIFKLIVKLDKRIKLKISKHGKIRYGKVKQDKLNQHRLNQKKKKKIICENDELINVYDDDLRITEIVDYYNNNKNPYNKSRGKCFNNIMCSRFK